MIKVLLADNQMLTREGIIALLASFNDVDVVGTANEPAQLSKLIGTLKPAVVIIDHHLNELFDSGLLKSIHAQFDFTRILILSNNTDREEIAQLVHGRICSYVSKECSTDELIKAIYATAKKELFLCNRTLQTLSGNDNNAADQPQQPTLTLRESEIIQLISEGLTNKEIAEKLFLSFHTIKTHRKNIIKKLGFTFKNTGEFASLIKSLS